MERSLQEQSMARQAKLHNARKLVAEMEYTLLQFSDMVLFPALSKVVALQDASQV